MTGAFKSTTVESKHVSRRLFDKMNLAPSGSRVMFGNGSGPCGNPSLKRDEDDILDFDFEIECVAGAHERS